MTKPTLQEQITAMETAIKHHYIIVGSRRQVLPAILETLRAHAKLVKEVERLRAMLSDERIVRLPKHAPSFTLAETWPYVVEAPEALAQVAAWDAEREQSHG